MKSWRQTALFALAVAVGGCISSGAATREGAGGLTYVHVSVVGDTTGTEAMLVDGRGRRTGRLASGNIDEVPGCRYSGGWDDGIPDDEGPTDLTDTTVVQESPIPDGTGLPPRYHSFGIVRPERGGGLLGEGRCDLLVESGQDGSVRIGVQGGLTEPEQCEATLTEILKAKTQYRWRVTWKALGDSCIVKIARVSPKPAGTGAR